MGLAVVTAIALAGLLPSAAVAADEAPQEPPKPSFAPVVEKNSRQITACDTTCWLRDRLFGSSEELTIAVRQTEPATKVEPISPKVVLQGQQDGDVTVIGEDNVDFVAAKNQTTQDQFTITLGGLADPGEYNGALLFATTASKGEQVSVPVTVKVREEPLWPIVWLIGFVALGAAIGYLLNQRSATKFRRKATDLRAKIEALPESDRSILMPLWNQMWAGRDDDLAKAEKRLAALTGGAEALRLCRDAKDEAQRSPMAIKLTRWVQRIGNATDRVVLAVQSFAEAYDDKVAQVTQAKEDFSSAVEAKEEVDSLSARAKAAATAGEPYRTFQAAAESLQKAIDEVSPDASQSAPDLEPLRTNLKSAFVALEAAHGEPLDVPAGVMATADAEDGGAFATALGWPVPTAATDATLGGLTMFDVRAFLGAAIGPLAALGVMLILLAVGFKVTYLDNATFGANPTDWLTLAFWGLAAYGARSTLTGLSPAAPAATKS